MFEHESVVLHEKGAKRVSPLFIPTMISNMAAGNLSIRYGMKGDCLNIVTACATGTHCIGEAYRLIRFGYADAALAGGTEEGTANMSLAGLPTWVLLQNPMIPRMLLCRSMFVVMVLFLVKVLEL